jgi:hypothetical protein
MGVTVFAFSLIIGCEKKKSFNKKKKKNARQLLTILLPQTCGKCPL